ncbi:TonB-dependent receptor domain-containing protein [Spirosoma fluminis]
MKSIVFVLGLTLLANHVGWAQSVMQPPGSKSPGSIDRIGTEDVISGKPGSHTVLTLATIPRLAVFWPDSALATGTAVLLFPKIGLTTRSVDQESRDLAARLTALGITVFVLPYRTTQDSLSTAALSSQDSLNALSTALADGKQALGYLRQHAVEFSIRPDQIGVLGVSTGGTLALQLVYNRTEIAHPNFVSLLQAEVSTLAAESVPTDAPALFIATLSGTAGDKASQVAIQTAQLYQQWLRAGRSAELHSYVPNSQFAGISPPYPVPDAWLNQWRDWLHRQGYGQKRMVAQSQQTVAPPEGIAKGLLAPNKPTEAITISKTPQESTGRNGLLSLSGIVRDSATGRELPGATILIDYEKIGKGTYTNDQGQFLVSLPSGKHVVVIRSVGYQPYRTTLYLRENTTVNVRLPSVSSQLEEVVVTSKGYDRTVRQPLLGVSQINISTLKKIPAALGEVDILRGLQMLPGVTSVGEAANGLNIRGGTTDQNLILLDDTPIFNPTHMFGLFSVFPADAVSGLDLYKGNVPARYGGRAASVLDISLRNPNLTQLRMSGGVSLVANRFTIETPLVAGKVALLFSGRGAFNDFLLRAVSPRFDNIRAKFGDATAKLFWRVNDRNTVTAMGYYSQDLFQTDLVGSLANVNAVNTQYAQQTANGMVRWFHAVNSRVNVQTTALIARYIPRILSTEDTTNNQVVLKQALLQRQLKSNLNYQLENQKLEIGVSATHYRLNPGELIPGNSPAVNYQRTPIENALELGIHAEDEIRLSDQLAVSAGLRYSHFLNLGPSVVRQYPSGDVADESRVIDSTVYGAGQVSKSYGGFEPRLGLRYALTSNSSIKLGYNLMRQYLQVITNTTTPLPTARWKTADTHIQPQVSQLWSAGYFRNSSNTIFELSMEVYWRSTQHILDYKPGADFLLQPYPETQLLAGRSKAYGMEVMISKKKGELTGWINYTYSRTLNQVNTGVNFQEQINGGNWYRANYDRPHSLNVSLTLNQTKHHSFSFNFAYSSGRPYTSPEGFIIYQRRTYPYYDERNQNRLPAYHRLDFSWNIYNPSRKNRRWQGHWNFTVYNLYGRKNVYSLFYQTEGRTTKPYQLSIFGAPIPSLTYNFNFN